MDVFVVVLDFAKDDENMYSQPFMNWRDHFLYCAEAIFKYLIGPLLASFFVSFGLWQLNWSNCDCDGILRGNVGQV